jgi:undecaprenyl diphosphate synthase
MDLLFGAVARELPRLAADGVQLHFIGDRRGLSEKICLTLQQAEIATAGNLQLVFNVCFNYGGRWDIAQAAAHLVKRGHDITEQSLDQALAMAHVPDPDLLIRTGGEQRLSNFVLWQAAYSELYFSDRLWPDFDEQELDRAIADYSQRERRFGKTSQQLGGDLTS